MGLSSVTQNAANGIGNSYGNSIPPSSPPSGSMLIIGKPCTFNDTADPGGRVTDYLRNKMTLIDLLPCQYKIDLDKIATKPDDVSHLAPKLTYTKPIEQYKKAQGFYGLPPIFDGIRIYSTDEMSTNETISNKRVPNKMEGFINGFVDAGQQIREFVESDKIMEGIKGKTEAGMAQFKQGMNSKLEGNAIGQNVGTAAMGLAKVGVEAALSGRRVAFPTIWQSADYRAGVTANVKLVSPYGHPKAIKEFIIKPLMYLLILSSPKTTDGILYGRPFTISMLAYGLAHSPLVSVSNITLQRGGADTSFNVYRQPLAITVTISFDYLVGGFAAFDGEKDDVNALDKGIFAEADQMISKFNHPSCLCLPTLGHMIHSLKPLAPDSGTPPYANQG